MSERKPGGVFPAPPAHHGPAKHRPPADRPPSIESAFRYLLASITVSVIGTVVTVLTDPTGLTRFVRNATAESGQSYTDAEIAQLTEAAKVFGGVAVLLIALAFVLLAVVMRAGRNWARLLLTGFTGFTVVSFLSAVATSGAELVLIWNLAEVACAVAAVYYLFRPESSKFFAERRRTS